MDKVPEAVQLLLPYLKGAESILCTDDLDDTISDLRDSLSEEDVRTCILIAQAETVRRLSRHQDLLSDFFDKLRSNIYEDPKQVSFRGLV